MILVLASAPLGLIWVLNWVGLGWTWLDWTGLGLGLGGLGTEGLGTGLDHSMVKWDVGSPDYFGRGVIDFNLFSEYLEEEESMSSSNFSQN